MFPDYTSGPSRTVGEELSWNKHNNKPSSDTPLNPKAIIQPLNSQWMKRQLDLVDAAEHHLHRMCQCVSLLGLPSAADGRYTYAASYFSTFRLQMIFEDISDN